VRLGRYLLLSVVSTPARDAPRRLFGDFFLVRMSFFMDQTSSTRVERFSHIAPPQVLRHERGFAVLFAFAFFALWSLPVWGAIFIPAILAYLVVAYDIYWTAQALYSSLAGLLSFRRMRKWTRMDWQSRYLALGQTVQQLVVIPNYDERLETLSRTLDCLSQSAYPADQLSVVLAMEEREAEGAAKAEQLRAAFDGRFRNLWVTFHPLLSNETAGKGANLNYALRSVKKHCDELGWDLLRVMVTTIDADTRLHPHYLAAVAVRLLEAPAATRHFFQGALLLVNNIWDVHAPIRVLSAFWTFTYVTGVTHYQRMTTAVYSATLRLLDEANYWDPRVVAEDGHIFFRSFFALKGRVDITPIYLPVCLDAVRAPRLGDALRIQYRQMMRWAWTVSNLPYIADQAARHSEIPLRRKLEKCVPYFEGLLIIPASWFVITFGVLLPPLINPMVPTLVFGIPLATLAPLILAPTVLGVIVALAINLKLRAIYAPHRKPASWLQRFGHIAEWLLLIFSAVFYFGVPYAQAYWRLLRGNDLQYERTPK
jgi:cellulose synthase/poly-beta-1,6-N-acetylglucosamine synthase-like glycosyltransferase